MKKFIAIAACIAAVFMLGACVPTEQTSVLIGPEEQTGPVDYSFVQLHNDTLAAFEGLDMYSFIQDLDISGDKDSKMITVSVVVPEELDEELLDTLAAAILRRINDAAMYQDYTLSESTALNMGDFWKEYGCKLSVYAATESGEKGDLIREYTINAGEDSGISPDVETYEEEWLRQLEILERNAQ